ncbi:MAG: UvrD-helicase domain-containing protein [Deltaproteobacteria bacterium]|nr:UvrD-helicase domain-containing protein [Deltaproteobacteria bacterium]
MIGIDPMGDRGKESILKKDGELEFPHVLIINASAGTGKTYTLTHRYVQFLLSDKIKDPDGRTTNNISNILAITFTRKAAKEMKAKIIKLLANIALGKEPEDNIDGMFPLLSFSKKAALQEKAVEQIGYILDNYSDFHIQTIDKFMARIMRSSADELGLRPDQEISTDYTRLIDTALYSIFSRHDKEIKVYIDDFLRSMPTTGTYKWNPTKEIKKIFESLLTQENKLYGEFYLLREQERQAQIKKVFSDVLSLSRTLAAMVPDKVDERTKSIIKDDPDSDRLYRHIYDYLSQLGRHGILHGVRANRQGGISIDGEAYRIKSRLDERTATLIEQLSASHFNAYIALYGIFKNQLKQAERSKSLGVHIQQVSKILSDYLNEGTVPEIYLKLGDIIYHYLIDEFQDTDKIQWQNLRALIEESLSKGGSLFVVGDLKQAIYMFRNADYGIMKDLLSAKDTGHSRYLSLDSLPNGIDVKNLIVNYRSDEFILKYADEVFKNRLKNCLIGGNKEDVTGLTSFSWKTRKGKEDKGRVEVKTALYEQQDEKDTITKDALLTLLKGDSNTDGLIGRFHYKDILILVQKKKHIRSVVEWLNEAGIPVVSSSSLDIRTRKIISEIIALLKFLDSPVDNLSFAQFIMGNIFIKIAQSRFEIPEAESKHKVSELLHAWRFHGKDYLYTWFKDHTDFSPVWESDFSRLFASVGYKPVYELVSDIYKTFNVFENFGNETAFLVKFLDTVNVLQADGLSDIKELLSYAQEDDDHETPEYFSIALPEYINAVNVMTFHGSKGLERPVVINILYDEKDPNNDMYIHDGGSSGDSNIKLYRIIKRDLDLSEKLRKIKESRETEERVQMLNTLYVINTRAKHELYNLVITKKDKKNEKRTP